MMYAKSLIRFVFLCCIQTQILETVLWMSMKMFCYYIRTSTTITPLIVLNKLRHKSVYSALCFFLKLFSKSALSAPWYAIMTIHRYPLVRDDPCFCSCLRSRNSACSTRGSDFKRIRTTKCEFLLVRSDQAHWCLLIISLVGLKNSTRF